MNSWQLAQQLKKELQSVRWPDGAGDVVFGTRGVYVYAGTQVAQQDMPPGFPFALVSVGTGTPDRDDPDVIEQQFGVVAVVDVTGDPFGEFAMIGSSRADIGKSAGAGVLEVAERVRAAVQRLTYYDGASTVVSGASIAPPATQGNGRNLVAAEFTVTSLCTSQPTYGAPSGLRVSGSTWTWTAAWLANRFDFQGFRLGYVNGSTPVTSPDDLDGVVWNGTDLETVVDPVAGRVYHLFADYDGRTVGTNIASDALVGSYLRL